MQLKHPLTAFAVVAGLSLVVLAEQPATQPAGGKSADQVMKDLNAKLEPNPAIEPTRRPGAEERGEAGGGAARPTLDPVVLGNAPGAKASQLRHEGEFVVNRLGRLVRAPGGNQMMFAFEADSRVAPESPMVLLPCRILENMEELVQERGESVVFTLSGEVTVYHGANYLLPTKMVQVQDKGNLRK